MNDPEHVVIVDDEPGIRFQIEDYFTEAGYRVTGAADGTALRGIVEREPVDVILLDLRLPGEDGLTIARDYLARKDIPFIMLTARGEVADRVAGLEIGADDYVPKPFHLRELLARVRTVLRRRDSSVAATAAVGEATVLRFAGWSFDLITRLLTTADGREINLTTNEFNLLSAFVNNPNQELSRDRKWEPLDRSIDVLIGRLRRKIETDAKMPQLIQTVRGLGYIFTGDVSRD
jgi:DNA-binding response OmpR family regulator